MINHSRLRWIEGANSLYNLERVVPSTASKILFATSYSAQANKQIIISYPEN